MVVHLQLLLVAQKSLNSCHMSSFPSPPQVPSLVPLWGACEEGHTLTSALLVGQQIHALLLLTLARRTFCCSTACMLACSIKLACNKQGWEAFRPGSSSADFSKKKKKLQNKKTATKKSRCFPTPMPTHSHMCQGELSWPVSCAALHTRISQPPYKHDVAGEMAAWFAMQ